MGQLESAAGKPQPAIGRIDLLQGFARRDLRMVDNLLDLPDAGAGRAGLVENFFPLARVFFRQRLFYDGAQCRFVFLPREPVGETRIFKHIGTVDRRYQ